MYDSTIYLNIKILFFHIILHLHEKSTIHFRYSFKIYLFKNTNLIINLYSYHFTQHKTLGSRTEGFNISKLIIQISIIKLFISYSHSMVAGGLVVISYTIRLICFTSLMIRTEILSNTSYGIRAQSAVMKSVVVTPRSAKV